MHPISQENIASPPQHQTLRAKFKSLRSRSETKLNKLHVLKSSRQSRITFQLQQKPHPLRYDSLQQTSDRRFSSLRQRAENELFRSMIVQNNQRIRLALRKLHTMFIHYKVPEFYFYLLLRKLRHLTEQRLQDTLNRQVTQLKQNQSYYQKINATIKARQGCLKQLSQSIANLDPKQSSPIVLQPRRQLIVHYRQLTSLVIRQIREWKEYLEGLGDMGDMGDREEEVVWVYKGGDYFDEVLRDCGMGVGTGLGKYVGFGGKGDPFLLGPGMGNIEEKGNKQQHHRNNGDNGKETNTINDHTVNNNPNTSQHQPLIHLFTITPPQKAQYLTLLNYLADQKAKHLRHRITIKEERMKDISRIYQARGDEGRRDEVGRKEGKGKKVQMIRRMREVLGQSSSSLYGDTLVTRNKLDLVGHYHQHYIPHNDQSQSPVLHSQSSQFSPNKTTHPLPSSSPLITRHHLLSSQSPYNNTLNSPFIPPPSFNIDFDKMLRTKELMVLKEVEEMKGWRRGGAGEKERCDGRGRMERSSSIGGRSSSIGGRSGGLGKVKISDSLSRGRDLRSKREFLSQLEQIVKSSKPIAHLIQQSSFTFSPTNNNPPPINPNSPQSPHTPQHPTTHPSSLLLYTQQTLTKLRSSILQQIQQQQPSLTSKLQTMKRQQHDRVQAILQDKIQREVLRHVNKEEGQQVSLIGLGNQRKLSELQQQLRKEFQLHMLREVRNQLNINTDLSQTQLQNLHHQQQLHKSTKNLIDKSQREARLQRQTRFQQIQQQQRALATRTLLQLQEQRKAQLQQQLHLAIHQQKQKLQQYTLATQQQLQHHLKQQMKQRMVDQLKQEKQHYYEKKLMGYELKVREEEYREEVTRRLGREMGIGEGKGKGKGEKQRGDRERERNGKMMEKRLGLLDKICLDRKDSRRVGSNEGSQKHKQREQRQQHLLKQQQYQQQPQYEQKVPNNTLQTHLHSLPLTQPLPHLPHLQPSPPTNLKQHRLERQRQKQKMREQFQVELFAFMKPDRYDNRGDGVLVKDVRRVVEEGVGKMENNQGFDSERQLGGGDKMEQVHKQKDDQEALSIRGSIVGQLGEIKSYKQGQQVPNHSQHTPSSASPKKPLHHHHQHPLDNPYQTSSQRFQRFSSPSTHQPTFKPVPPILGMTPDEYEIYMKKKELMDRNRSLVQQKGKDQRQVKRGLMRGDGGKGKKEEREFQLLVFGGEGEEEEEDLLGKMREDVKYDQLGEDRLTLTNNQKQRQREKQYKLQQGSRQSKQSQQQQLKQIHFLQRTIHPLNRTIQPPTSNQQTKHPTHTSKQPKPQHSIYSQQQQQHHPSPKSSSQLMILTVHSHLSHHSVRNNHNNRHSTKRNQRFMTSGSEKEQLQKEEGQERLDGLGLENNIMGKPKKESRKQKEKDNNNDNKRYKENNKEKREDVDYGNNPYSSKQQLREQQQRQEHHNRQQDQFYTHPPHNPTNNLSPNFTPTTPSTFIKPRLLKPHNLQPFMKDHFSHMTPLSKRLNLYKRDELIKVLKEDHKSFTILQHIEHNQSLGLSIVSHNEKKTTLRSFSVIHIGAYDPQDTLKLLVDTSRYVFSKDPAQQLTLSIFYMSDDEDQSRFIKQFEKGFGSYGAMFQKNVFQNKWERKMVIRRAESQIRVKEKEKVNCGRFLVDCELEVREAVDKKGNQEIQGGEQDEKEDRREIDRAWGVEGVVSMYLAQSLEENKFVQVINGQRMKREQIKPQQQLQKADNDTNNNPTNPNITNQQSPSYQPIPTSIKHLAQQCLALKPSIHKICTPQQFTLTTPLSTQPSPPQTNPNLQKPVQPLLSPPPPPTLSHLHLNLQLIYPFTSQRHRFIHQDQQYEADYMRFTMEKAKRKVYQLRSKVYNEVMWVVPCKNQRYKVVVMGAGEFDQLRGREGKGKSDGVNGSREKAQQGSDNNNRSNNIHHHQQQPITLSTYTKLFLSTISTHTITSPPSLLLPQFTTSHTSPCHQLLRPFLPSSSSILTTSLQHYYTQYLPNSLTHQSTHRDLVIQPPFIIGVIDSQMQLVAEGSTVVVSRVGVREVRGVEEVGKVVDND